MFDRALLEEFAVELEMAVGSNLGYLLRVMCIE